ncbi:hypothetical protein EC973_000993 [Apophysomyces ossiformis]|uniref:N-terminal of MaoC-like dehydratase domain-containing protein n=1 Tax=Apophysomyces ossiformis TaxID=679940 RepID=A0A8H7BRR8_9FUNG|nr:hypothetical protein EC973_000993 [Apophysomyces ossiformis]
MFRRLTQNSLRRIFTSEQNLNEWQKVIATKKIVEHDKISASQFNLMGNTLNDPFYNHGKLPAEGTELPPAWHLAYFPPRVPENALSPDGFEKEWQPPQFPHRMWAGGELQWNPKNPLRVGDHAKMESAIRDVQFRPGGRRGDSLFIYVDKHMSNERGWAATESRCWVYVKDNGNDDKSKKAAPKKDPLSAGDTKIK